jgi:hypothetical protein
LEEGHGILIDVHSATSRDEDIDAIVLLADGDGLAIQETTVQDEPFHYPLAHCLYELFYQLVKHWAFVVFA